MFLHDKYIYAKELTDKMGINIANISMLRKKFVHDGDLYNIKKLGNCLFINTKCHKLPNNITQGIKKHDFTKVTNVLPCAWIREQYGITERELDKSGIVLGRTIIAGRKFFVFKNEIVERVRNYIPYILDSKEVQHCSSENLIIDSIQLSKNKFLAWY